MVVSLKNKGVFEPPLRGEVEMLFDRDRLTILLVCQTLNMEDVLVIVGERMLLYKCLKKICR